MASTSQIRSWWAAYECNPARYTRVSFPGSGRSWHLTVASESRTVWEAVSQIMTSEPYLFLEAAGGTYNCRNIGGTASKSIHAYALALDINPSVNPHRKPLTHDYPRSFIERMEGITANGLKALQWGGRWATPDAMHWQIDVPPGNCHHVEWDRGDGQMGNWAKPGDPVDDLEDVHSVHAWQGNEIMTDTDIDYDENDARLLDERYKIITARIVNVMMK